MVGVIIIGHGDLPEAMFRAVEHVLGRQAYMEYINVRADDDPAAVEQRLRSAVARCDVGGGVVVCADMFGGTPCNISLGMLDPGRVEIVSGFSLPCLIAIVSERTHSDDPNRIARKGAASGRRYLCLASRMLERGR